MKKLDLVISRVLAVGLVAAVALMLVGAALALAGRGPSQTAMAIEGLPRALSAAEPSGFLMLGLLVLLATPVARVVALAVGFARRGSWVFCAMSVFVLALLGLSAYLGLSG